MVHIDQWTCQKSNAIHKESYKVKSINTNGFLHQGLARFSVHGLSSQAKTLVLECEEKGLGQQTKCYHLLVHQLKVYFSWHKLEFI